MKSKAKRRLTGRSVFLTLVFVGLTAPSFAQDRTSKLVTTEWLAAHLDDENIRVVDMRMDIRDYWQSHIPGAVYLDPAALRWPDRGVPSKVLPPEALAQLLGQMGIREDTMVIVYYDKNGYPSLYLLWALDLIGHRFSASLEDGIERWRKEGRPLTQDFPVFKPVSYRLPAKLPTDVRANAEDVRKGLKSGAVVLDVRPADLFSGEKGAWKRKGHIKGAVNHFWALDMNGDGTWKTREELAAAYEKIGVTAEKTVIVYCGQGQMAAHTYFALRHVLGFPNIRLFDGSFNEWSARDDLPVEASK